MAFEHRRRYLLPPHQPRPAPLLHYILHSKVISWQRRRASAAECSSGHFCDNTCGFTYATRKMGKSPHGECNGDSHIWAFTGEGEQKFGNTEWKIRSHIDLGYVFLSVKAPSVGCHLSFSRVRFSSRGSGPMGVSAMSFLFFFSSAGSNVHIWKSKRW